MSEEGGFFFFFLHVLFTKNGLQIDELSYSGGFILLAAWSTSI